MSLDLTIPLCHLLLFYSTSRHYRDLSLDTVALPMRQVVLRRSFDDISRLHKDVEKLDDGFAESIGLETQSPRENENEKVGLGFD
jgi:hypothetical protein